MRTARTARAARALGLAAASLLVLAGCAPGTTSSEGNPEAGEPRDSVVSDDATAAAAELLRLRYELVRDGDYAGACALYMPGFAANVAELAGTDPADCVAAHEAGIANAADYLETAAGQDRAGLTPFFYVPSGIEIDDSLIYSDEPGEAVAAAGAVVSTDPREFEDGAGKTPGWLAGIARFVRDDDGVWRFAAPGE